MMEDNKLIAEFMGTLPNYKDKLEYHKSWDLLMTVVETIESLVLTKIITNALGIEQKYEVTFLVSIILNSCVITSSALSTNNPLYYHKGDAAESKIEATYKEVVDFIKWYNKQ